MTSTRACVVSVGSVLSAVAMYLSPASAAPAGSGIYSPVQADLRNLATLEESYFTDKGHYGSFLQMKGDQPDAMTIHRGITIWIVHIDDKQGYCFRSTNGKQTFVYDSQAGGVLHRSHCKVTTTGRYGGRRTGPATI